MCHLLRGNIAQSLSMKTNIDIKKHSEENASFTQDRTGVTYTLLSETMHLLQVPPGRGERCEALKNNVACAQCFQGGAESPAE